MSNKRPLSGQSETTHCPLVSHFLTTPLAKTQYTAIQNYMHSRYILYCTCDTEYNAHAVQLKNCRFCKFTCTCDTDFRIAHACKSADFTTLQTTKRMRTLYRFPYCAVMHLGRRTGARMSMWSHAHPVLHTHHNFDVSRAKSRRFACYCNTKYTAKSCVHRRIRSIRHNILCRISILRKFVSTYHTAGGKSDSLQSHYKI